MLTVCVTILVFNSQVIMVSEVYPNCKFKHKWTNFLVLSVNPTQASLSNAILVLTIYMHDAQFKSVIYHRFRTSKSPRWNVIANQNCLRRSDILKHRSKKMIRSHPHYRSTRLWVKSMKTRKIVDPVHSRLINTLMKRTTKNQVSVIRRKSIIDIWKNYRSLLLLLLHLPLSQRKRHREQEGFWIWTIIRSLRGTLVKKR
jgi:hypothetical protein